MSVRYDDRERTLTLSVRDLVEEGAPRGHLTLAVVQTASSRLAQGREVHLTLQGERGAADAGYRAEVRVQRTLAVGGWTVSVHGRVDGLAQEDSYAVVEEIKSTTLDAGRLYATGLADWPDYVAQLELYLWMLAHAGHDRVVGRLLLVSLADGARHVLGVPLDAARVQRWVMERLEDLVEARERRIAWMTERRAHTVPPPHDAWRPGQREIAESVEWGLEAGHQVLIEAPTGLGKTAAALVGALRHALAHDKVVFWATSRTTQQPNLARTFELLAERGLPLRAVLLNARDRTCLNDVVACRPDACRFANGYYDKLRQSGVVDALCRSRVGPELLRATGEQVEVCPFELGLDVSEHVDVVVGDYNYVFDPAVHLRRHAGDGPAREVIVVVDEVHQLVERARGYGSPRLSAALADRAAARLTEDDGYAPFAEIAGAIADRVRALGRDPAGPARDGAAVIDLPADAFADLAARVDAVGLEYAALAQRRPLFDPGEEDSWLELARGVLRLHAARSVAGPDTVAIVDTRDPSIGLLCLDPSRWLGPWIRRFAGFVGLSATLSPPSFHRDLLGLDGSRLDVVRVPSPFPPERRKVIVAPRVSTAYRDRAAHAAPTAALMQRCVEAIDGNVAVYFPSFEMLRDLVGRWTLTDRELCIQEPSMSDAHRRRQLERLSASGPPVVLAAVMGGIFAEGVDLPPGALSGVIVAGPALPPVGLERDLLRAYYEERFGQGFRYASLVPGLTRVVQAAGRLIRRPEDRGVIVLVDRRFRWREVTELLPDEWVLEIPEDPVAAIVAFQAAAEGG